MNRFFKSNRFAATFFALFLSILLAGCSSGPGLEEEVPMQDTLAVQDTSDQVEEPHEIVVEEETTNDSLLSFEEDSLTAIDSERLRLEEELQTARRELQVVYFLYDQSELSGEAREILQQNAEILRRFENRPIVVEGHCDERGSTEYNLALGERRAATVKQYYINYGLPAELLRTISYGEERPEISGTGEEIWARNRRAVTRLP